MKRAGVMYLKVRSEKGRKGVGWREGAGRRELGLERGKKERENELDRGRDLEGGTWSE